MTKTSGRVRVLPVGVDLEPLAGESVMDAAVRSGYRWPTVCGGTGTCRTCFLLVEDGYEHCSQISALEAEGIDALAKAVKGAIRLACQLRVDGGDVTVRKRGVKLLNPTSGQGSTAAPTAQ